MSESRTPPDVAASVRRVVLRPRGGDVEVERAAAPVLGDGEVLIRTAFSVVSPGTERSKLELAGKGLLGKARSRPELVREVLDKARREGPAATLRAVRRRLGESVPLGYSSAGTVLATGRRVDGVSPGDRVAAGGSGYALHADVVAVPKNLVAKVPDGVSLDAAAFATLGSVALHGVRLAGVGIGETVVVVGLGVVGLLAGLLARAAGCRVLGVDLRAEALDRARKAGLDDAVFPSEADESVRAMSGGLGADAVLLCAAASDDAPVVLAGRVARDRARVVVVGDVPVHAPRDLYFSKELEIVVSRSYGPGRYDPSYEEGGHDYPAGYVRWTERRNFEAFLRLLEEGTLDAASLVTHRFPVADAPEAYRVLTSTPGSVVLLEYGEAPRPVAEPAPRRRAVPGKAGSLRVGLIGGGSFAERVLVPAIRDAGADVTAIVSTRGRTTAGLASVPLEGDVESLLGSRPDAVFIATRHDSHARLTTMMLEAGVPVFVEKPLALSAEELDAIVAAWSSAAVPAMVGFNRAHASLAAEVRAGLNRRHGPGAVAIRVNAGALPEGHWSRDLDVGGGRILGELCHFVDLAGFLLGAEPVEVFAQGTRTGAAPQAIEDVAVSIRYGEGSLATLAYTALGDVSLGKERVEAFAGGEAWAIDDWRSLTHVAGGRSRTRRGPGDKGHAAEVAEFLRALRAGDGLDGPFLRAVATTRATLAIVESLSLGIPVAP